MPTVIDATVVNQAYDTSGNGGRKLVRLSNGWLVAAVKDVAGNKVNVYKSTDNGQTWQQAFYVNRNVTDVALANIGTKLYVVVTTGSYCEYRFFDMLTVTNDAKALYVIDSGNTAPGNVSIAINSTGTEIHAAWSCKHPSYPNSFNIRYAKGTINADGSVTWGSVEQITFMKTSGQNAVNPCIIVYNNTPYIIVEWQYSGANGIAIFSKALKYVSEVIPGSSITTDWGNRWVYNGGSYIQSSPSACVAPNGRIWVAWHGRDSTDTSVNNIRVSYSDDGGKTWAAMEKLTSGNKNNKVNASITANHNNEVFILYWDFNSVDVYKIKHNGTAWETPMILHDTSRSFNNPSALFDNTFSLDFSEPLFIFQENTVKVGFYGTWTVTTISVPQGYIGQKTSADKSNILSYSITTDDEMSDIIEKINGTIIATRTNPASGQEFTVSLTQEQWDAIKYGNAHTLTIEMGSDTWTYTFDKRLNANDDILSAVKGVQDLQDHLNSIKAQLAAAIRAKGGTVNDTDAWSAFVNAITNIQSKRQASGTGVSSGTSIAFKYPNGTTTTFAYLTVTGLTFKPSMVVVFPTDSLFSNCTILFPEDLPPDAGMFPPRIVLFTFSRTNYLSVNNYSFVLESPAQVVDGGFTVPVGGTNRSVKWYAFE